MNKQHQQQPFPLMQLPNVLWISGRVPKPLFSGDALYSWGIIQALGHVPLKVCVAGTSRAGPRDEIGPNGVEWITCSPRSGSGLFSLLRKLPKDVFLLASPEFCKTVEQLLDRDWSWIVIDHANSSGVLPVLRRARAPTRLCYVAHNAEGLVRPAVAAATERFLQRAVMRLDAEKYRRFEIATVKAAHCIISISDVDAQYFSQFHRNVHVVPPVFMGKRREVDTVQEYRPRALLLVGSFDWIAKQRNLETIVSKIGPMLQQYRIVLNVVGYVAPYLKERLEKGNPWLRFHGQLADYSDVASQCRGGLLAEGLGGGFKLKTLDYAFMRLPIFALIQATSGTTVEERAAMFAAQDHSDLATIIVENIDKLDELNRRQQRLYELASRRYSLPRMVRQIREIFAQSV